MTRVFALLTRSLRVDERSMRTHLMRVLFIGMTYVVLIWAQSMSLMFGAAGLQFFTSMSYLNFWFITLAGAGYFATSITEEKEERTLGLLKMAGVSSVSILLGKSTSRLISAFLLLSAQFPFTLLAVTLGGVTVHQVLAMYCALLAYLLFLSNLALLASVCSPRSKSASTRTVILLGLLLFLPTILNAMIGSLIRDGQLDGQNQFVQWATTLLGWFVDAVPLWRISIILGAAFTGSIFSFQVISNSIAAVVLFGLSWLLFDFMTRNELPVTEGRRLFGKRIRALRWLRPGRAWTSALTWKDFHFTAGGKLMLIVKFLIYGGVVPVIVLYSSFASWSTPSREDIAAMWLWIGLVAAGIELPLCISRIFQEEVKWKTLSLVYLLPVSLFEIAALKVIACVMALIPALFWVGVGVVLNPEDFFDGLGDLLDETGFWMFLFQYALFLYLVAFLSLVVKWAAFPLSIAIVYLVNGICMSMLFWGGGPSNEDGVFVLMIVFAILGMGLLHISIGARLHKLAAN